MQALKCLFVITFLLSKMTNTAKTTAFLYDLGAH